MITAARVVVLARFILRLVLRLVLGRVPGCGRVLAPFIRRFLLDSLLLVIVLWLQSWQLLIMFLGELPLSAFVVSLPRQPLPLLLLLLLKLLAVLVLSGAQLLQLLLMPDIRRRGAAAIAAAIVVGAAGTRITPIDCNTATTGLATVIATAPTPIPALPLPPPPPPLRPS